MSDDNKLKGLMNKVTSNPIYTGKIKPVLDKVFKTPISKKIGLGAVILIVLLLIVRCFAGGGSSSSGSNVSSTNDKDIQTVQNSRMVYNKNKTIEEAMESIPLWRVEKWDKDYDDDGYTVVSCYLVPDRGVKPFDAILGDAEHIKYDTENFFENRDKNFLTTISNSITKWNPGVITKITQSDVDKISAALDNFEYKTNEDYFFDFSDVYIKIDFTFEGKSFTMNQNNKMFYTLKPKKGKSIDMWDQIHYSQTLAFIYRGQTIMGFGFDE